LLSPDNGKLCFAVPGINSVPQNHLPLVKGRETLRSRVSIKNNHH
jgi:hypothetical protein